MRQVIEAIASIIVLGLIISLLLWIGADIQLTNQRKLILDSQYTVEKNNTEKELCNILVFSGEEVLRKCITR